MKTLFIMGSLEVYYDEDKAKSKLNRFYWKDKYSPQGCGPFESVYAAVKDYTNLIKLDKEAEKRKITNIIEVDFVNKRRVS